MADLREANQVSIHSPSGRISQCFLKAYQNRLTGITALQ
jgi:hypothetical protein